MCVCVCVFVCGCVCVGVFVYIFTHSYEWMGGVDNSLTCICIRIYDMYIYREREIIT